MPSQENCPREISRESSYPASPGRIGADVSYIGFDIQFTHLRHNVLRLPPTSCRKEYDRKAYGSNTETTAQTTLRGDVKGLRFTKNLLKKRQYDELEINFDRTEGDDHDSF